MFVSIYNPIQIDIPTGKRGDFGRDFGYPLQKNLVKVKAQNLRFFGLFPKEDWP